MIEIEKAQKEKKSTRTGKAIGKKNRAKISIAMNDENREISPLWEIVKKYYSNQNITAAETAHKVFMRGLTAEIQDITLATAKEASETEQERLQGSLF